jgi:hypothetical protein
MATTITEHYAQLVFNHIITGSYVALIRQDGTECPIGRVVIGSIVLDTTSNPDYHVISNTTEIVFPIASSDVAPMSNPVSKVALYRSNDGDDKIAETDLATPKPYLAGDQFRIPVGMLKFKIQKIVP